MNFYPILCLTTSKQTTPVATETFKESISPGIDNQFLIDANEIWNIAKNRMLPTKMFAHTVSCEITPKNRLCLSRIISHLPCLF